RGLALRRDDRAPPGLEDRLRRGDRLAQQVDQHGRAARARPSARQERLRRVPAAPDPGQGRRVKVEKTELAGLLRLEPRVFGDARGYFLETWNERVFAQAGIEASFVQDNHSRSARNVLRGLHYQIHQPQGKLVRVVSGAVWDVAVD